MHNFSYFVVGQMSYPLQTRKKLVKVPLPAYLYKFLEKEGTITTGLIDLTKRFYFPMLDNGHTAKKYFQRHQLSGTHVQVYTQDPRQNYLYAMVQYYKGHFETKMLTHIFARHGIMPYQVALKDFLDQYDIAFDEYKLETGYKKWQRSKEWKLLKQKQPNE